MARTEILALTLCHLLVTSLVQVISFMRLSSMVKLLRGDSREMG